MIVTFHLAVYLACYFWDTYISQYITRIQNNNANSLSENQTDPPNGVANHNTPDRNVSPEVELNIEPENPESSQPEQSQQNPKSSSKLDDKEKPSVTSRKEGESDHPCLPYIPEDEDRGRDIIYNVEPEYSCVYTEDKIQFFPPVFVQRYMEIERILKEPQWAESVKKVIDFGCAELSFEMKYLKRQHGIEEIVAVDIDTITLEYNCCKLRPLPVDYLKKRPSPLSVRVFHGSVAHTHSCLTGADAVIAIELIEHLFPPELDNLPFTIFGFIRPKIAIFTTPNSDFNVLFHKFSGFRHPDHKFEWSRLQFEDWAHNLVQRYPDYQVQFKGIGPGPEGKEDCGCCSQMATFIKVKDSEPLSDEEFHIQDGVYTLIADSVFPFYIDQRTEEEKIRDAAHCFVTNCRSRRRLYDEVNDDIPLKVVMSRIKYYDSEKLKKLLLEKDWEVKVNSSGEEVVLFPDSEEEEDSEPECNEYVTSYFGNDFTYAANTSDFEENWDIGCANVDVASTKSLHDLPSVQDSPVWNSSGDHACKPKCYHSEDIVDTNHDSVCGRIIEKPVSSDKISCNSEMCSISETSVPDIKMSDKVSSRCVESVAQKDTNLNFETSIYETPNNKDITCLKYDCDSCDCSLPLSDQTVNGCNKALFVDSPKELAQSDDPLCLSTVSSSCDTSIYATPCCSQRHRNNIPKCLSLQQISTFGSPAFCSELNETLIESKLDDDRFSKSMEGFKSLENDLTCSSTSRVVDSGYPESYSECNMDMDLTPEQFDDIETESEENDASSRSLSPPPLPPQIPWLMDDVQNGDVANNNRDGEGNNLVVDMDQEPLEFEARIDEINNEVLNLAPVNDMDDYDHEMKLGEPVQEVCGDCLIDIPDTPSVSNLGVDQSMNEKVPNHDLTKVKSVFTEKNTEMFLNDSIDKKSLRSTKSDNSISTNASYCLDPLEDQMDFQTGNVSCRQKPKGPKLKTHTSLTTVLDGCSKFSDCSIVRPVEVYQLTGIETHASCDKQVPGGSTESQQPDNSPEVYPVASLTSELNDEHQSILSVYQSAESINVRELIEQNDSATFPDWLLNILVPDSDESDAESVDSLQSIWDSDSLEERLEMDYDVQVDARGGGDPQRDAWQ